IQARLRGRSRNGSVTTTASTRPRRPSTVHSTATFEPGAAKDGGTEARPIACFRIGLQPWLVSLPIWVEPEGPNTGTGVRSTLAEIAGGRPARLNDASIPSQ